MLGTIVNIGAIISGSLLGIIIRNGIKDDYKKTIMDGLALSVIVIGIMGGIKSENIILVIVSVVLGSFLGEIIGIEEKLDRMGARMEKSFGKGDSNFSKGFVTASLVYCIGAMSIVGALEAGLMGSHDTLFAKSVLDGVSSIIFASTLGIGVIFSIIPVFIYQGGITILAGSLRDILTPDIITEISAVGGILILAIGINILGIKKIKIANMLPAIFIPIIYSIILSFF